MQLQREELTLTRLELKGQREQMELQNATVGNQAFEATFFQLLSLHHEIVAGLRQPTPGGNVQEAVGRLSIKEPKSLHTFKERAKSTVPTPQAKIDSVFRDVVQTSLGHYFRNLYHVVRFVHESDVSDKKRYTSLIRAQLSRAELALLFYNCLSGFGVEKFKPLD